MLPAGIHSFSWISEQTAVIRLYRTGWFFITEKGRVYCEVRTESVNIIHVTFLSPPASVIPQTLHTRLDLHIALTGWTNLHTRNALSQVGEFWEDKYFVFVNLQ